jgi:ketosteroid isomerase-like protein
VNWSSLDVHAPVDAGPPMPTAKERAASEKYAAALGSPGFGELGPLLDEDVHFYFPGGEEVHGREAVVRAHETLLGAFDERVVVAPRVWRTATAPAGEGSLKGVQARNWMGVADTRKAVSFRGLSLLWTKDDGSLSDIHLYFDVAAVQAMLGVGPKTLLSLPMILFPAPGTTPQVFEQAGTPEEKKNVAVVSDELDALEGNRDPDYVAGVTDDVELDTPEHEPRRGKDAFKAYDKGMHKAVSQLDTTIENSWGVGRFAIVEYFISGEQIGPIEWIPAQRDKVVRLQTVDIAEIRDGKIAHLWRYYNPSQIAVGVAP